MLMISYLIIEIFPCIRVSDLSITLHIDAYVIAIAEEHIFHIRVIHIYDV
jgi:hypothetical protein